MKKLSKEQILKEKQKLQRYLKFEERIKKKYYFLKKLDFFKKDKEYKILKKQYFFNKKLKKHKLLKLIVSVQRRQYIRKLYCILINNYVKKLTFINVKRFNVIKKRRLRDKFLIFKNKLKNLKNKISFDINETRLNPYIDMQCMNYLFRVLQACFLAKKKVIVFFDVAKYSGIESRRYQLYLSKLLTGFPNILLFYTSYPGFISNNYRKDLSFNMPKFSVFIFLNYDSSVNAHNVILRELNYCLYDYILVTRSQIDLFKRKPLVTIPLNLSDKVEFEFFYLCFLNFYFKQTDIQNSMLKLYVEETDIDGELKIIKLIYLLYILKYFKVFKYIMKKLKLTNIKLLSDDDINKILSHKNKFKKYIYKRYNKVEIYNQIVKKLDFYQKLLTYYSKRRLNKIIYVVFKDRYQHFEVNLQDKFKNE